ncbi:hypothetical protein H0H92_006281 [Tricholoma furcatifolium]|nr:hypothetical protein H0H92_006281 [Tricholoma furcatifolium]
MTTTEKTWLVDLKALILANAASSADLWSKLTPAEQSEFLCLMGDPDSDLAKKLLASEELEDEQCDPWWDAPALEGDAPISYRYSTKPNMMLVPAAMMKPSSNGPPLFYNVCAVCIAYAFVTRHLSISPLSSLTPENIDFEESKRLLSQLVPFLIDKKSTTLYPNMTSLVTDIRSRFQPAQVNSGLFAVLLKDAARLLRPLPVTSVPASPPSRDYFDPTNHPHSNAVLALSDLTKLFEGTSKGVKKSHVTQKLLFYAAHILSTPSEILGVITEELVDRSMAYQVTTDTDRNMEEASAERGADQQKELGRQVPLIEEI